MLGKISSHNSIATLSALQVC